VARRLSRAGSVLAVTSCFLVACAEPGPPTLDTATVTDGLPAAVWPRDPEVVTDASCPELVETPVAQATRCEARIFGDPITIDVTVDELGETASTVREPLFDVDEAAGQLGDRLLADLGPAAADLVITCETSVLVAIAGSTVACTADRAGDELAFEIRLLDADGRWSWRYTP
jgi:hypothetical protein